MRLLLQVMFAQGYLWRDRFPESFPNIRPQGWHPQLFWLAFALILASTGALGVYYGSVVLGPILLVTGLTFALVSGDSFSVSRYLGSTAFWTSVSWAAGTLTTVGFAVLLPFVLLWTVDDPLSFPLPWSLLVASACYLLLFGSMNLHLVQRRYLFFADPDKYAEMLKDPTFSPRELWLDTYFNFPREIVRVMLGHSSGGER